MLRFRAKETIVNVSFGMATAQTGLCVEAAQASERCALHSGDARLGWELQLMTSDVLRSQVCHSSEEVLNMDEAWKAALLDRGHQALVAREGRRDCAPN